MTKSKATDVSTTTIVRPGPVIDFLRFNQDIKDTSRIDWGKVTAIMLLLCYLVSLQRYRALTVPQRSSLVEKSRKNPSKRKSDLSSLKAGNGQDLIVRNGRWNFNHKVSILLVVVLIYVLSSILISVSDSILYSVLQKLIELVKVNTWVAVNFSTQWNVQDLVDRLIRCGGTKGIVGPCLHLIFHIFVKSSTIELFDLQKIQPVHTIFEESLQRRELRGTPEDRVNNMIISRFGQRFLISVQIFSYVFFQSERTVTFMVCLACPFFNQAKFRLVYKLIMRPYLDCVDLARAMEAKGTTRPTHYHVLHDEIGFSPNDLEELVHSLSYVYDTDTACNPK
ncbi:hypothetical protein HU200_021229 [Digitaria exilis]|uniref:Piwi domain-containing protein n=1 Tax=Digitaria exilis TaxID=1010633 RepID=A0A835KE47_9POAL|nr:hypothetical protein HU200_021229 [Digitaria exilis]